MIVTPYYTQTNNTHTYKIESVERQTYIRKRKEKSKKINVKKKKNINERSTKR